jgi:prevent-host-death family protein
MDVSVRDLKAHLSAVLRAVALGQAATITSHKRVVARLLPPLPSAEGDDIDRLLAAGLISQRPRPGGLQPRQRVKLPPGVGSLSDAVIEDRG